MGSDLLIQLDDAILEMESATMTCVYHQEKNFTAILDQGAISKTFQMTGTGVHDFRPRKDLSLASGFGSIGNCLST